MFHLTVFKQSGLSHDNFTSHTDVYNTNPYNGVAQEKLNQTNKNRSSHRSQDIHQPSTTTSDRGTWFTVISSDVGLHYSEESFSDTSVDGYIEGKVGSGVFAADYNNDGWIC